MRYAVIGSRTFDNYSILFDVLEKHYISQIVSGGAKGADSLAARYANEKGIPLVVFLPDWDKYDKKAGFVRNKEIVKASDILLAFWNGQSRGTKHSIDYAKKLNIKTIIVTF